MQQLAVVGFVGDIVVNDQPAFDIDDTLEIIGRELRRPTISHWSSIRLSEDHDVGIMLSKFGLPLFPALLTAFECRDRAGKRRAIDRLIARTRRVLIRYVEAGDIVGDFWFGIGGCRCPTIHTCNILSTSYRSHLF